MPWDARTFKARHAHALTGAQSKRAARQANAMLRGGVPEGEAIATAIKQAKRRPRPPKV